MGVERFGIREDARGLVVSDDAVAAKHLAGPRNGLAALGLGERFGERRVGNEVDPIRWTGIRVS